MLPGGGQNNLHPVSPCKDKKVLMVVFLMGDLVQKINSNSSRQWFGLIAVAIVLMSALAYWYIACHNKIFLIVFALLVLGCLVLSGFLFFRARISFHNAHHLNLEEHAFLLALILMGIVFVFAFPPGSVPDESHHFWSSYTLADVLTGHKVDYANAQIEIRTVDAEIDFNSLKDINKESFRTTVRDFELFNSSPSWTMVSIPSDAMNLGANPFYIKLPTALSIVVARFLNLGFYPLFYLGRIVNFTLFIVSIILSVRITPIAKNGFRAVALLPMTLHLCASYSYDAGIICLSLLLTACLLRLFLDREMANRLFYRIVIFTAVLAILLAPCKVIYFAIFLLFLFLPNSRFSSKSQGVAIKLSILMLGLIFILLMRGSFISGLASAPAGANSLDHRGLETGEFYSMGDALRDPLGTIVLYIRTMDQLGDYYIQTLIGGSLGWLQENIRLPMFYVFSYIGLMLFSFRRSEEDKLIMPFSLRIVCALLAIAIWFGAMTSMYLGWTFNTEQLILGVQGRYFLPAVPLLFLALRSERAFYSGLTFSFMLSGMLTLNSLALMRTFAMALVG